MVYLGDLGHSLTEEEVAPFRGAGIVLIPAGSTPTIAYPEIPPLLDAIGPRFVMPMHYKTAKINLNIKPLPRYLEALPNDPVLRPGTSSSRSPGRRCRRAHQPGPGLLPLIGRPSPRTFRRGIELPISPCPPLPGVHTPGLGTCGDPPDREDYLSRAECVSGRGVIVNHEQPPDQEVPGGVPGNLHPDLVRMRGRPRLRPDRAQSGLWQVAIVWGIAIMLAATPVGAISGAHINPAITVAFAVWGRFPWRSVAALRPRPVEPGPSWPPRTLFVLFNPYLKVREQEKQVVRGAPGSEITAMCYGEYFPSPGPLSNAEGPYSVDAHERLNALVSEPTAFLAELLGTLVLATGGLRRHRRTQRGRPPPGLAPVFIGLTVAALISVIAPLTQACFNPARDFGPRLFASLAGWGPIALPGPRGRVPHGLHHRPDPGGDRRGGSLHPRCQGTEPEP